MIDYRETPLAGQLKDRCHSSINKLPDVSTQSRVFISGRWRRGKGKNVGGKGTDCVGGCFCVLHTHAISYFPHASPPWLCIYISHLALYLRSPTTDEDPGLGRNVWKFIY